MRHPAAIGNPGYTHCALMLQPPDTFLQQFFPIAQHPLQKFRLWLAGARTLLQTHIEVQHLWVEAQTQVVLVLLARHAMLSPE